MLRAIRFPESSALNLKAKNRTHPIKEMHTYETISASAPFTEEVFKTQGSGNVSKPALLPNYGLFV